MPILAILIATAVITPLTTPINTTMIIPLSKSEPVKYTTMKIRELLPNAIILKPNNPLYNLYQWRNLGEAIYVSHGTERGILIGEKLVKWGEFTGNLRTIAANSVFIASCYSQKGVEEAKKAGLKKNLFGFKGYVDVDEAAYTTAAMINFLNGKYLASYHLYTELTKIMFGKITEPWKYNLWLLAAHYVRGIWWVYWKEYQTYNLYVDYTHPNTYKDVDPSHYYDIGINEKIILEGVNLIAYHIPKSDIDSQQTVTGILWAATAALVAWAITNAWNPTGWVAAALAAALAVVAAIGEWAISYLYDLIRDESGSGWSFLKDKVISSGWGWTKYGFDIKWGEIGWWHFELGNYYGFPYSVVYPLWYGGKDLGIGGI